VLFLAALVLFSATFVFNTLAELVRQRLRKKYSSL
jgi:phosphate transport system permease protein